MTKVVFEGPKGRALHGEENVKTFDLIQYVDRPLPASFHDWPNQLQDLILGVVEQKATEYGLPLKITASRCDCDDKGWFIHCVVQYIPQIVVH